MDTKNDEARCVCGDSVRSVIGTCPPRGHREFYSCPKREGLFPVDWVLPNGARDGSSDARSDR